MLLVVRLVLHHRLPSAFIDLDTIISAFVVTDLSLQRAVKLSRKGCTDLLEWLWDRSIRSTRWGHWSVAELLQSEPCYRRWAFAHAMLEALRRADPALVEWLLKHFLELPVTQEVMVEAAKLGLKWAFEMMQNDAAWGGIDWTGEKHKGDVDPNPPVIVSVRVGNATHVRVDVPPQTDPPPGEADNEEELEIDLGTMRELPGRNLESEPYTEAIQPKEFQTINSYDDPNTLRAINSDGSLVDVLEASRNIFGDKLISAAAKEKHWDLVHWLTELASTPEMRRQCALPASYAFDQHDLEQLKWLGSMGFGLERALGCNKSNQNEWIVRCQMLHYVIDEQRSGVRNVEGQMFPAFTNGDLEAVQWLHGLLRPVDDAEYQSYFYGYGVALAAAGGHISVAQWLSTCMDELGLRAGPANAMYEAAKSGSINAVEWLYTQYAGSSDVDLFQGGRGNPECETEFHPSAVFDIAAKRGHLNVLKFLHRIDHSYKTRNTNDNSQARRQLSIRCTPMAMDAAAEAGHLDVVRWLHENRTEGCTTAAMDRAAANGHLEVVKWLHFNRSEGCTTSAMDCAAFMKFHDPNEHQITPTCCLGLAPNSFLENQMAILEFLRSNRSEGFTTAAMDGASIVGNLKIVQWLHANTAGCTTKAMDSAAGIGRLDMVKWLHENRSEGCTSAAMDIAAANGHLEVVKWLHANRSEGCPATALDAAAGYGSPGAVEHHNHLRVVQWIVSHCDGLRLISAIGRALLARNFEVALFLHAQQPTYCEATRRKIKAGLRHRKSGNDRQTLLAWLDQNYPPPAPRSHRFGWIL